MCEWTPSSNFSWNMYSSKLKLVASLAKSMDYRTQKKPSEFEGGSSWSWCFRQEFNLMSFSLMLPWEDVFVCCLLNSSVFIVHFIPCWLLWKVWLSIWFFFFSDSSAAQCLCDQTTSFYILNVIVAYFIKLVHCEGASWANTVLIIEQIDKVVCKGHRNLLFWCKHLRNKSFGLHVLSSNLFTNTIGRVCVWERER